MTQPSPTPLDPATTRDVLASLLARSDGGSFVLTSQSVPAGTGQIASPTVPPAVAQTFAPVTQERVQLTWNALYRNTRLGGALVCDAGVSALAQAVLTQLAQLTFNLTDLHLTTLGSTLPLPEQSPGWPYSGA